MVVLVAGCTASTPTPAPSTPATSPSTAVPAPDPAERRAHMLAAITLVEEELGGRVVEAEWEGSLWDVEVLVGDVLHEVAVDTDGSRILQRDERPDHLSASKMTIHAQSTVAIDDAIATATAEHPDATLEEAELEEDYHRWEVEMRGAGGLTTVVVDSRTGAVLP